MIAVDWEDFDAPRGPDHKVLVREGLLLQLGYGKVAPHRGGTPEDKNVAFVITRKLPHDPGSGDLIGQKVIVPVALYKIRVKGVNLPFEVSDGD